MNRWYIPGVPPDIQALVERRNPTVRHYHQASEQCPTSPPCSTRPSASPPSAPIRKQSAAPPPLAATFSSSCPPEPESPSATNSPPSPAEAPRWSSPRSSPSWTIKPPSRSEEHTSELQSRQYLVCR